MFSKVQLVAVIGGFSLLICFKSAITF